MSTFRPPLRSAYYKAMRQLAKARRKGRGKGALLTAFRRARKRVSAWRPSRTSDKGLAMLTREEGSIPYAYNDPVGHATFGVGHLIHFGNVTRSDQQRWGSKSRPRRDLVMPTLRRDIAKYEAAVRRATKGKLKRQHQFDACVSLAFNIGTGGFESSTVAQRIREGKLGAAADAFLLWDNPSMLRPRRERERRLFLTGHYI